MQEPRWGTLKTPKWTYITILTKNKFHLAHFDHARCPYISLKWSNDSLNLKHINSKSEPKTYTL